MGEKKPEKLDDAELDDIQGGAIDAGESSLVAHELTHVWKGDSEKAAGDVVVKGSKIKEN